MFKEKNYYLIIELDDELVNISDTINNLEELRLKKSSVQDIEQYDNEIIIRTSTTKNKEIIEEEYILSFIDEEAATFAKLELEEILDFD